MGRGKDTITKASKVAASTTASAADRVVDYATTPESRTRIAQKAHETADMLQDAVRADVERAAMDFLDTVQEEIRDRDALIETPTQFQDLFSNVDKASRRVRRSARFAIVDKSAAVAVNIGAVGFSLVASAAKRKWVGGILFDGRDLRQLKPSDYPDKFERYIEIIDLFNKGLDKHRSSSRHLLLNIHVPKGEQKSLKSAADSAEMKKRHQAAIDVMMLCADTAAHKGHPQHFVATHQADGMHVHAAVPVRSLYMTRLSEGNDRLHRLYGLPDYDIEYESGKAQPYIKMEIGNMACEIPLEWVHAESLRTARKRVTTETKTALAPEKAMKRFAR